MTGFTIHQVGDAHGTRIIKFMGGDCGDRTRDELYRVIACLVGKLGGLVAIDSRALAEPPCAEMEITHDDCGPPFCKWIVLDPSQAYQTPRPPVQIDGTNTQ